ncbi:hypothetical protein, partial [Rossellomorea marisflavi]|uniref:hypothetical protein n=1 Tax=Rossellomorea marisflavi TaxID=189381 RepID=UPI003D2EED71
KIRKDIQKNFSPKKSVGNTRHNNFFRGSLQLALQSTAGYNGIVMVMKQSKNPNFLPDHRQKISGFTMTETRLSQPVTFYLFLFFLKNSPIA